MIRNISDSIAAFQIAMDNKEDYIAIDNKAKIALITHSSEFVSTSETIDTFVQEHLKEKLNKSELEILKNYYSKRLQQYSGNVVYRLFSILSNVFSYKREQKILEQIEAVLASTPEEVQQQINLAIEKPSAKPAEEVPVNPPLAPESLPIIIENNALPQEEDIVVVDEDKSNEGEAPIQEKEAEKPAEQVPSNPYAQGMFPDFLMAGDLNSAPAVAEEDVEMAAEDSDDEDDDDAPVVSREISEVVVEESVAAPAENEASPAEPEQPKEGLSLSVSKPKRSIQFAEDSEQLEFDPEQTTKSMKPEQIQKVKTKEDRGHPILSDKDKPFNISENVTSVIGLFNDKFDAAFVEEESESSKHVAYSVTARFSQLLIKAMKDKHFGVPAKLSYEQDLFKMLLKEIKDEFKSGSKVQRVFELTYKDLQKAIKKLLK